MIFGTVRTIRTPLQNNDKNLHYESIKNYFRKDVCTKNRDCEISKGSSKQRKIFDLTLSILEGIIKNNPELTKAMDAGCGTGKFTLELSQKLLQLNQIVGIDFLKETINNAIEEVKQNKKISFLQADLLHIPFDDRTFDVTFCLDVLHHVHGGDFEYAIKELARITDKYLIVEIRNKKNIFNFWYRHVIQPLFYRKLPIYTTSMDEVNNFTEACNFHLYLANRIVSSRYSCRRLVLVYQRIDEA